MLPHLKVCSFLQLGQGIYHSAWLELLYSSSISDEPFTVGVPVIMCFVISSNVEVLFLASEIGLPSFPELFGYLSTSSRNMFLIGLAANFQGELAPTKAIYPPGNILCVTVFPESFLLGSLIIVCNIELFIAGCILSFEKLLAISSVG